jgi:5-methylthioadenosine/S-adenosylhomocysteine deaminase
MCLSFIEFNLGMFTDPAQMVVGAAKPHNVSRVMVDGRTMKEGGKMKGIDPKIVAAVAKAANAAIRKRAN